MTITFKQVDEQHVDVLFNGKKVGHIFSPAGSGSNVLNGIQVCGFEVAYDYWGCGVFGERKGDNVIAKRDIQLIYSEYDVVQPRHLNYNSDCLRCYNEPCTCQKNMVPDRELDVHHMLTFKNQAIAEMNVALQKEESTDNGSYPNGEK